MVPLSNLLIPILVSAVVVFVVSSVIHMVLGYHRNDLKGVADEDAVQRALRGFNLAPGDYGIPYARSMEAMKSEEFQRKFKEGPVIFMNVAGPDQLSMGKSLIMWFCYSIVVSLFAAYVGSRVLGPGADYLSVFRFVGTTAFAGYALGLFQDSIWWRRNWGMTLRSVFDGLLYALFTAGVFGWLWPK